MHKLLWALTMLGAAGGAVLIFMARFELPAVVLALACDAIPYVVARAWDELSRP